MEIYFNGYKTKYEILNRELLPLRASQKIKTMNIFINVDDLFHRLHKPYTDREFQCAGAHVSKQLVANLMNLIAHYKNWAVKEHITAKIYLIYTSSNTFKNSIRISSYRDHYNQIHQKNSLDFFYINEAINNAFPIMTILTKYIQNIYAIDSKHIEPSVAPLYLSTLNKADWNLIISRDDYDLQYAQMDKWAYILPKGENSLILNKGNLWSYLKIREKIISDIHLHPEMFLWTKYILGDRYRGIPKLTRTGWKSILQFLSTSKDIDTEKWSSLHVQHQYLLEFVNKKKIESSNIDNNVYCTDVRLQCETMLDTDKAILSSQLIDIEDIKALNEINVRIFSQFPINLPFLLKRNPSIHDKPNDQYNWRK